MKTAFLRFALLGLLAAGCSKNSEPAPPTAPLQDTVQLHVTGSNLQGLTARVQIQVAEGEDGKPTYVQPVFSQDIYLGSSVDNTITVGTFQHYQPGLKRYDCLATVSFTTQGSTAGQLKAEWKVNTKPSTATSRPPSVQITGNTPTTGYAYLFTNAL
jgi:hypothetical protein